MEKTTIIGNIGKDAQVNETNGKKAVNFTVAVNKSFKQQDGTKKTVTNWYSCTRWLNGNESAEVVKYLLKGTQVYVEGNLQPAMYKDKENQTCIDLKLNVKSIQLLGTKKDDQAETNNATSPGQNGTGNPDPNPMPDNDDLPF